MNVKTMLADFLGFVTPKNMHKARFSVLLDAVTALAKDARCIRRHDYQQGLKQILHWVAQWDWAQIKLAKS